MAKLIVTSETGAADRINHAPTINEHDHYGYLPASMVLMAVHQLATKTIMAYDHQRHIHLPTQKCKIEHEYPSSSPCSFTLDWVPLQPGSGSECPCALALGIPSPWPYLKRWSCPMRGCGRDRVFVAFPVCQVALLNEGVAILGILTLSLVRDKEARRCRWDVNILAQGQLDR